MADWALPREQKPEVAGFAYRGMVSALSGINLGHEVLVLGYNHNLQSSFGVTNAVICAIRDWISRTVSEAPA